MPLSDDRHRPWVLRQLEAACPLGRIRTAIDAGAGFGGWREFCGPWMPDCKWTAIEIWAPYSERFLHQYRYATVLTADLRHLDPFPPADVVFFGDVLEHMPADDAVQVWDRARRSAWRLVLGIPVVPYPQGKAEGNPFEEHVSTWSVDGVLTLLKGICAHQVNEVTGAFIAGGEADGPA